MRLQKAGITYRCRTNVMLNITEKHTLKGADK